MLHVSVAYYWTIAAKTKMDITQTAKPTFLGPDKKELSF